RERLGRNGPVGESAVERGLPFDQRLAGRYGFGLHRVGQLMHPSLQFGAELKLIRELDHMKRPRVTVQLGRQRKAHAASSSQTRHVLIAEAFDGPPVQARIWRPAAMLMLRECEPAECDNRRRRNDAPHRLLLSSSDVTLSQRSSRAKYAHQCP